MQAARLVGGTVALALSLLAFPALAPAAEPPKPDDPCVTGTRNTCGTTGVGFYDTGRYGTRWFGDFRGLVPGEFHMFCVDLRFWYPGPQYRYKALPSAKGLKNRDGEPVSALNLEKAAYAIWTYGRTTDVNQAAAVMLYVHSQMGDARPGELDPGVLNPRVVALHELVARNATRFHGPYRVVVDLPAAIGAGKSATGGIRVLSGAGVPLPNLELSLSATGAAVPSIVHTNENGVATIAVQATTADGVHLKATTEPVASTLPTIYTPTTVQAARNGQRLATSESQRVSGTDEATGSKAQLSLTSAADPTEVAAGEQSSDRVKITGALPSYRGKVAVHLYGPFRTTAEISCTTTPVSDSSFSANGPGSYKTQAATLAAPGLYQYQLAAPADANHVGFVTPCNVAAERVHVSARPALHTVVSAQTVSPGTAITDTVTVSGLAGEKVTVRAALYGPFPAREAITCTGNPIWTGSIDVPADGSYETEPATVTTPGYYTYFESIAAGDFVVAAKTPCADSAETAIVRGQPALRT
jgi:hypothetical protein